MIIMMTFLPCKSVPGDVSKWGTILDNTPALKKKKKKKTFAKNAKVSFDVSPTTRPFRRLLFSFGSVGSCPLLRL